MTRELVVGSSQGRVARCLPILSAVDEFLFVLDAHADGKWLLLKLKTELLEQRKGIARRMSAGQDES